MNRLLTKLPIVRSCHSQALIFNCDIQKGFYDLVYGKESVLAVAKMMSKVSCIFKIPVLVTEQNTKVFGKTLSEIEEDLVPNKGMVTKLEKSSFSMINEDTKKFLQQHQGRKQVVLYGMETHVCVQQTCMDLLDMDYTVHILVDGVSSINQIDRTVGLTKMNQLGAQITTSQSLIFEWLKTYKHPSFKQILPILKIDRKNQLIGF